MDNRARDAARWFTSQRAAARGLAASEPLVVYTAPKTGSTSVEAALEAAGIPALKAYLLGAAHARAAGNYARAGQPLPLHHFAEVRLRAFLARPTHRRLRIVNLVRDPLARRLSPFFQAPALRGLNGADPGAFASGLENSVARMAAAGEPLSWFPDDLEPTLALDLRARGFDREAGLGLYETEHARVLILKTEALDRHSDTLARFVGAPVTIDRRNVRAASGAADLYREAHAQVRLPAATLAALCASPYMRLFYTGREIESFVARWSGAAPAVA